MVDRIDKPILGRRPLLRAAAFASVLPLGVAGSRVFASPARPLPADFPLCHSGDNYTLAAAPVAPPTGRAKKIRFTWNQTALCTSAVPVAVEAGIFEKHNLDVALVNFGGSTGQLLEAIGSGKADAGIGMILRWLKPLDQGFDVKLVAGVHGGCSYLVGSRKAAITDIGSLHGKTIGVTDFASPEKNLYEIILQNHGLDPDTDVEWKQYPQELMAMAVDKGEIQAYVAGDPNVYYQVWNSNGNLFRAASNATDEFAETLVAQHVFNPRDDERDQLETWTASTALAAVTSRIEIIAAIKPYLFHPVVLAKMASQIDEISQGRFSINLVNAWFKPEFERAGITFADHDDRYAYGREWIEIFRQLFTRHRVNFACQHFKIEDYQIRPVGRYRPRPVVYAGGESDQAQALAADKADVWFINGHPPDDVRRLIAAVADRPRSGPPIRFALSAFVVARETNGGGRRIALPLQSGGTGCTLAADDGGSHRSKRRDVQDLRLQSRLRPQRRDGGRPGRQLRYGCRPDPSLRGPRD
jgi:alkanesulfonate monooxygenase SsuD/methylene tetrahydromethanopterin reductase-like flavin-dependent oxidoreductase (luciferase family)